LGNNSKFSIFVTILFQSTNHQSTNQPITNHQSTNHQSPTMLKQLYSPTDFRKNAHALVDTLADYLENAQSQTLETVLPWVSPEESLAYWQADFEQPINENPDEFFKKVIEKSTHLHHSRYMGHQVAVPAPLAALSGLLTGLMNNGMAVYEMGLVSNPLERIVTDWLAKKFGFMASGGGLLTSGGTLANLTALLTARAIKAPNEVWTEGNSEKMAVLVSEEAHYCVDRAARIMGWGSEGIIKIPTNERFQLRTELLESYLEKANSEGRRVIAIVGSACSTSTGSYDDLEAIADFAEKHGLWFHVDGAHGGAAITSKKHAHLLKGAARADSIIVDFHKMMMIPALATAVLFKKPSDGFQTFQQKAQYLWANQDTQDWFNSGKRTFECTKLMMSVKIYALLRTYGEGIFEEYMDVTHGLAQQLVQLIQKEKKIELALMPQSNIVCFRYKDEKIANLNQFNTKIRQKLLEKGHFYIVQTTLRAVVYLRVSLMNPLTSGKDLKDLLVAVKQIAKTEQ
jgi:L-2,4-diaminobutyrate decarboxylase